MRQGGSITERNCGPFAQNRFHEDKCRIFTAVRNHGAEFIFRHATNPLVKLIEAHPHSRARVRTADKNHRPACRYRFSRCIAQGLRTFLVLRRRVRRIFLDSIRHLAKRLSALRIPPLHIWEVIFQSSAWDKVSCCRCKKNVGVEFALEIYSPSGRLLHVTFLFEHEDRR